MISYNTLYIIILCSYSVCVCVHIYIYIHIYTYIYIYIYILQRHLQPEGDPLQAPEDLLPQKRTSKGIGRQGRVLKRRNFLTKEPMPCRRMPLLM